MKSLFSCGSRSTFLEGSTKLVNHLPQNILEFFKDFLLWLFLGPAAFLYLVAHQLRLSLEKAKPLGQLTPFLLKSAKPCQ